MSQLFKLREWLTLDESAAHISNVLGEPATVTDLYRFAIDGHLTISANFINHTPARKGGWIKPELTEEFGILLAGIYDRQSRNLPLDLPDNNGNRVSEDDLIILGNSIVWIDGILDVTMVGAEMFDLEHEFQQANSGPAVTLVCLDGVYVQQNNVVCQLQIRFDNNEFQPGSKASEIEMERFVVNQKLNENDAKKLRESYKKKREIFLQEQENKPDEENYFPSGGLSEHDHALVIRTNEITRFIQSLEDNPISEKPLTSKERNSLLVLIGALCGEAKIDPKKRGVTTSLVKMTENLGAPLTDDTVRKILSQIEDAVQARSK